MASVRQPSFAGGEIAPELSGRSDVGHHAVALRTLRNFLPLPYGPAQNRPGTVFVAKTKYPTATVRLVPFTFATGQNYVLEVGDAYVRFFYQGGQVLDGRGDPYEVATPYVASDLSRLRFAQSGDVLTITSPAHPAMELRRLAHADWELVEVDFDVAAAFFFGGTPRLAPAVELSAGLCLWREDDAHKAKPWQWAVTTICERVSTGRRYETAPAVVSELRWCGYELWSYTKRYVAEDAPAWNSVPFYALYAGVVYQGRYFWAKRGNQNCIPTVSPDDWEESVSRVSEEGITGTFFIAQGGGSFTSADCNPVGLHPEDDAGGIWWQRQNPLWQLGDLGVSGPVTSVSTPYGLPTKVALAPDQPVRLVWPEPWPATVPDGFRVIAFRVYRGQGGTFGWVGDVDPDQGGPEAWDAYKTYRQRDFVSRGEYVYFSRASSNTGHLPALDADQYWRVADYPFRSFVDEGAEPDYTVQPPSGKNPFAVLDADGQLDHEEVPAVACYHEQRRVFANTFDPSLERGRPANLFGSVLGDYANFDRHELVVLPTDAFDLTLATMGFEEVRALVSLRRLLVFTSGGEWAVGGAGGAPLSPLSVDARRLSAFGSAWLAPLVVGGRVLYLQEAGQRTRELAADADGYQSRDLSLWCRHLFSGHKVVDWTFAQEPHGVLWAVRDDGLLLSCTYEPEQEVLAWAWHDTTGTFKAACAVAEVVPVPATVALPSGVGGYSHGSGSGAQPATTIIEAGLYVIAQRALAGGAQNCVERLATRRYLDVREGVFMDCAAGYDGRNRDAAKTVVVTSAEWPFNWTAGHQVRVASASPVFDDATWVGDKCVLRPDSESPIAVAVTAVGELEGVHYVEGTLERDLPADLRGVATALWARAVPSIQVDLLKGLTLATLEDGVAATRVAAGDGTIAFGQPTVVARVGLGYVSDLELLDLAPQGAELRTKVKTVSRVAFEVFASRGLSAGETFDRLQSWAPPAPSAGGYAGTTGVVSVRIANSWNAHGRACLRQSAPMPLTVLSAIREVDVGG